MLSTRRVRRLGKLTQTAVTCGVVATLVAAISAPVDGHARDKGTAIGAFGAGRLNEFEMGMPLAVAEPLIREHYDARGFQPVLFVHRPPYRHSLSETGADGAQIHLTFTSTPEACLASAFFEHGMSAKVVSPKDLVDALKGRYGEPSAVYGQNGRDGASIRILVYWGPGKPPAEILATFFPTSLDSPVVDNKSRGISGRFTVAEITGTRDRVRRLKLRAGDTGLEDAYEAAVTAEQLRGVVR